MHSRHWYRIRSAVAVLVMALLAVLAPASSAATDQKARAAGEARVVRETWVGERMLDLTIDSPALGQQAKARLLLPRGWSKGSNRTWPVLYLLHGCCDDADYQAWTKYTDVEQFMAGKDVLTVLPSDGPAGFYTEWWNFGASESTDWETFHVEELRSILERDYGAGTRRAVGGLSIGGYGAMAYAFRHPGMFRAAASYSGLLHTLGFTTPQVISGILLREGFNPLAMWGDEILQYGIWSERNPYDNAEKLEGVRMYVSGGNGLPGPLDPPGAGPDPIEPAAKATSEAFTDKLTDLGIPVTTHYYGNGTHDWPYWQRELRLSWPMFAAALGVRS